MSKRYASEKRAIGDCDRCGQQYPLRKLRKERRNKEKVHYRVCPECWDPDHPQEWLGRQDYKDPQALRDPRVEKTTGREDNAVVYDFSTGLDSFAGINATVTHNSVDKRLSYTSTDAENMLTRDINSATLSLDSDYDKVIINMMPTSSKIIPDWSGLLCWNVAGQWTKSISSMKVYLFGGDIIFVSAVVGLFHNFEPGDYCRLDNMVGGGSYLDGRVFQVIETPPVGGADEVFLGDASTGEAFLGYAGESPTTTGTMVRMHGTKTKRPFLEQMGSSIHQIVADLRNNALWSGTIEGVSFRPFTNSGYSADFYSIRFERPFK